MNYKISVTRSFSAAHALRAYKGRCERLHGHTWKVRVAVASGTLDRTGMVADFTELKMYLDKVIERLDHQYLNEVSPFTKTNPTAENIAAYIYREMQERTGPSLPLAEVEVWESETSSALVTA